jgi:hypothetical protein
MQNKASKGENKRKDLSQFQRMISWKIEEWPLAKKRTTIGAFNFDSVKETIAHIHAIIQRTANERPLQGDDAAFVSALFAQHPEYPERTKNRVIMHYTVSTSIGGSRCFYVRYDSGRLENFSYEKCLKAK